MKVFFSLATAFILAPSAYSLILYGGDNNTNTTAAGTTAPFDTVARLQNSDGTTIGGSGVHLGGGYILTANHVNPIDRVTFDGTTIYTLDSGFAPTRIGTTDLKVFKLSTSNPLSGGSSVGAATLYTGTAEASNAGTLIGWGVGRDSTAINSSVVGWGAAGTSAKRWGTNSPTRTIDDFVLSGFGTFDALETVLGNSEGANEAAATQFDSGAGLFQNIGGTWFLTGIASAVTRQVSSPISSTFGIDAPYTGNDGSALSNPSGRGDANFFNRVSSYESQIAAVIPEPSTLLLTLGALPILLRRRRKN